MTMIYLLMNSNNICKNLISYSLSIFQVFLKIFFPMSFSEILFTGIKPFACDLCENKFSSKVSLQEHMAIHTNSKPHVCHICHAPFRQISCLRRHLITHSTDKPFECNNCGQKFSQMVYLKSHSKVHTGKFY